MVFPEGHLQILCVPRRIKHVTITCCLSITFTKLFAKHCQFPAMTTDSPAMQMPRIIPPLFYGPSNSGDKGRPSKWSAGGLLPFGESGGTISPSGPSSNAITRYANYGYISATNLHLYSQQHPSPRTGPCSGETLICSLHDSRHLCPSRRHWLLITPLPRGGSGLVLKPTVL